MATRKDMLARKVMAAGKRRKESGREMHTTGLSPSVGLFYW